MSLMRLALRIGLDKVEINYQRMHRSKLIEINKSNKHGAIKQAESRRHDDGNSVSVCHRYARALPSSTHLDKFIGFVNGQGSHQDC